MEPNLTMVDTNTISGSRQPLLDSSPNAESLYTRRRRQTRALLTSDIKHYIVMGLVAMDVGAVMVDILLTLVACDLHQDDDEWARDTREGLHFISTVFSCLFGAELTVTVWAFGLE